MNAFAYDVDANLVPTGRDLKAEAVFVERALIDQEHRDIVAFYKYRGYHIDQYGRLWTGSQAEGWHTRKIF